MGVIKRGILGGFKNKVANVVGSSWKGIAVIKSLPLSVANPRTPAQQQQRAKFKLVSDFAAAILGYAVKPLWDRNAQYMSGFNRFIQYNLPAFSFTGIVDPEILKLSIGSLTQLEAPLLVATEAGSAMQAAWTDNSGDGTALATDIVYAVGYNADTADYYYISTTRRRDQLNISFTDIDITAGQNVWVWLGAKSLDNLRYMDGIWLSAIVGA